MNRGGGIGVEVSDNLTYPEIGVLPHFLVPLIPAHNIYTVLVEPEGHPPTMSRFKKLRDIFHRVYSTMLEVITWKLLQAALNT